MYFKSTAALPAADTYIADSIEYLNGCKTGKYSSRDQWGGVLSRAKEIFSYGLEHGFVLCGNSPDGRHARKVFEEYFDADVVFADSDEVKRELNKNRDRTFIICSKKFCTQYTEMLKTARPYLNYNHLWMLDPRFQIADAQFYGGECVRERMEAVADYADVYLDMLKNLEDQPSRELLAKTVLYRVTLDDRYEMGINSGERQYFDHGLVSLKPDTVFVDAGGFNGDTLRDFLDVSKGEFSRYYFFEPVPTLLEAAKSGIADARIDFLPCCLWDKNETVVFGECASNSMSGHIVEEDDGLRVQAVSLDDFLEGKPVSFIKMDIEGAEMKALQGAKHTIEACCPVLAISAYHMPDDLTEIYKFCKSIGGYRLYLRTTECNLDYELVLFAIPV